MKAKIIIKTILVCFYLLITINLFGQKYNISGYVEDKDSKERLIGAFVEYNNLFFQTNGYGYFNLKAILADTCVFRIHHIGYKSEILFLHISSDTSIVFQLQKNDLEIEEIVINSKENMLEKPIGMINLDVSNFKIMPMLGAEVDILKGMQMLSGVTQSTEGKSDLIVHGGSSDQNLIIIDDAPVYYLNHLGGFVSIFNINTIKNVELYKTSYPARYGGRLSSVIDIRTKDGDMKNFHYNFTISPVTSNFFVEGPIIKEKLSFIFGYRRSFIDLFTIPYTYLLNNKDASSFSFYDANLKFNYKFSNNNKLFISFYKGKDNSASNFNDSDNSNYSKYKYRLNIGNSLGSIRWNTKLFRNSFSNFTFIMSKFKYNTENKYLNIKSNDTTSYESRFYSSIFDMSFNNNSTIFISNFYKLFIGFNIVSHTFEPANSYFLDYNTISNTIDTTISTKYKSEEYSAFLENDIKLGKFLILNLGLRYNVYKFNKKFFNSLQPRVDINIILSKWLSLKSSYTETTQNIHKIQYADYGGESALWLPATNQTPPENAKQVASGVNLIFSQYLSLNIDLYFKKTTNLLAFEYGTIQNNANNWEENCVKEGIGISKGIELFLKKTNGKVNGWIAYTYSKTTRQFAEINLGNEYLYEYDRPHDFKIFAAYKLNENIDFSIFWIFQSGRPISLPSAYIETIDSYNILSNNTWINHTEYFTQKNSYRMKPYHRLDLSVNFKKQKEKCLRIWSINIYNTYNRQNPYFYFFDTNIENGKTVKKLYQQSLFPIIPSISYSLKF
ncbi:MAG: TonB-dependent receptor [Bacteroidales bacterium]|nr:TonB-dependent receptor [Bacteroidales bacterium]